MLPTLCGHGLLIRLIPLTHTKHLSHISYIRIHTYIHTYIHTIYIYNVLYGTVNMYMYLYMYMYIVAIGYTPPQTQTQITTTTRTDLSENPRKGGAAPPAWFQLSLRAHTNTLFTQYIECHFEF